MRLAGALVTLLAALGGTLAVNNFGGIAVSNSIGGTGTYTCRTQAQWNTLAQSSKAAGFKAIRIIGFDCDALNRASSAATSAGMQVIAGIFWTGTVAANNPQIDQQVTQFKNAVKQFGANRYIGLTVGNENTDTPTNIMTKVASVRSSLQSAGIKLPVTTVHTWVNIRDNPILCQQGDFVGANAHAFFDPNTAANQAGTFVMRTVVPILQQKCPGKRIIITESGWPSRGPTQGKAVPSIANERTALHSLNCAANPSASIFAFEYDDQLWKGDDNERSFGIFGKLNVNTDVVGPC